MVPGQTGLTVNIDTSHATGYPALCTNGDFNTLTGHDDWLNIVMPFQQFAESATGPVNPSDGPEPTDEQILAQAPIAEHHRPRDCSDWTRGAL